MKRYVLILVVQGTVSPPPKKPLTQIHLCVNGRPAVITPNITLTLRVPIVTNRATPVAANSAGMSVTKGGGSSGELEVDVLMEGDDDHASDGEDSLACCACKQAASALEEYEEDGQHLPGDGSYGSREDEGRLTNKKLEFDIIHAAEQLALEQDEAASNPEDDSEDDDISSDSSDSGDKGDPDFVPKLKPHRTKHKVLKATGGKNRTPNRKMYTNYIFCPLSHRLSILCLVCKHFCQHPILPECHGQTRTPQQIHWDTILEAYYHCKANKLHEVWAYLWTNWYAYGKWELWA